MVLLYQYCVKNEDFEFPLKILCGAMVGYRIQSRMMEKKFDTMVSKYRISLRVGKELSKLKKMSAFTEAKKGITEAINNEIPYEAGASELPLTNEQGEKISLEMPDLSGEYYRKLVEERYIDKKIYDELQQADVILFFLNPETMEREERIKCEETSAIRMVDEDMDIENVPGSEVRITEPRKATETQVVELLQILLYIVKKKMCIKFVISAWDRVEKKQEGNPIIPEEYLKVKFMYMRNCTWKHSIKILI